ncbi:MAG TPA: efflux RND transporter periplasmic adaptor subunit [Xanthobacteraceae bacterium]|nr:efflux RND transporter periplasmic adaptor subunit [Xanthobacteraceae bacterium]
MTLSRTFPAMRSVVATALLLALAACGDSGPPPPPPPPVTVAKPVALAVVDRDEYVGRFLAVDMVEVRARVAGYLEKVHFKDGQIVNAGDVLFTIDPRPFQNTLDQARSTLAQARANLDFATADLARAEQLLRDKTMSEQQFQQRTQSKRVTEATVQASEAAVRQAQLDLEFTQPKAPVTGRIGDRRVSPGNLVVGGSAGTATLLATIVSIDPIRLEFSADEQAFLRYARLAGDGKNPDSRGAKASVDLKLLDENDFVHKGTIDFVDNVIDQSSGTIRARALFANPDGLFTPGMFGRVRVPASPPYQALTVPETAIGTEQVRKFVYVVGPDDMVQQKYITLGPLQGDRRVIKEGLTPDDRVIVNGIMRARPGIKVTPVPEGAPGGGGAGAPGAAKQKQKQK